ncbi:hypothetical protein C8239_10855, partial [Paracidovorax avenae]
MPAAAAGWWALRFTPRVALLDEAVLLEVSCTERLWGGRAHLLALLRQGHGASPPSAPRGAPAGGGPDPGEEPSCPDEVPMAQAPTALQALALLRLQAEGRPLPRRLPHGLPLATLTALR